MSGAAPAHNAHYRQIRHPLLPIMRNRPDPNGRNDLPLIGAVRSHATWRILTDVAKILIQLANFSYEWRIDVWQRGTCQMRLGHFAVAPPLALPPLVGVADQATVRATHARDSQR